MVKLTSISTLILFAGVALAKCDDKELAAVKAEFYSNGIVPDVLPSFDPKALAYITFDYKNGSEPETILTPGTRIGRNDSQIAPTFSIVGLRKSTRQKYVGFVVDPDAPSRANPTRRNIRHMMATDLTLATASSYIKKGLALGSTVAPANEYRGPNPPIGSGPHRYIFLLYKQPPGGIDISWLNLTNRAEFNLTAFTERTGLATPLAGTYFQTEQVNVTAPVA